MSFRLANAAATANKGFNRSLLFPAALFLSVFTSANNNNHRCVCVLSVSGNTAPLWASVWLISCLPKATKSLRNNSVQVQFVVFSFSKLLAVGHLFLFASRFVELVFLLLTCLISPLNIYFGNLWKFIFEFSKSYALISRRGSFSCKLLDAQKTAVHSFLFRLFESQICELILGIDIPRISFLFIALICVTWADWVLNSIVLFWKLLETL